MTARVAYLAHPVAAADAAGVRANIERTIRWLRWLVEHTSHAISAPWIAYVQALLEEMHRDRGLADDLAMLERCDVVIMVGDRVSAGMALEAGHARACGIPVIDLTDSIECEPPSPGSVRELVVLAKIRDHVDVAPLRRIEVAEVDIPRATARIREAAASARGKR